MKKLWLLLLVIPLQFVHSQAVKHAPTVEQCRADQKLWLSQINEMLDEPNGTTSAKVGFSELEDRLQEMEECTKVDPNHFQEYTKTLCTSVLAGSDRLGRFIGRHNLWDQFIAEDAQGCRGPEPCKLQGKR